MWDQVTIKVSLHPKMERLKGTATRKLDTSVTESDRPFFAELGQGVMGEALGRVGGKCMPSATSKSGGWPWAQSGQTLKDTKLQLSELSRAPQTVLDCDSPVLSPRSL
jgi:hypothetical protein